jgi:3-oxoacyl-[acyl-carrier-protein] synthase II
MSSRRVVVTGLGLITPLGNSPEALWNALTSGTSGVRPMAALAADSISTHVAAECLEFTGDVANFGPLPKDLQRTIKKALKMMCRDIMMGAAAAQLSVSHAGIDNAALNRDRVGVVYGCDFIVTRPEEFNDAFAKCRDEQGAFHFERWGEAGIKQVDPLWLLKYLPNMPNSHIAIFNDYRGPNNALTVREAAANLALAEAYQTIERGHADMILAGATGTRVHPLRTIHAVLQEEVAVGDGDPAKVSRPFDAQRSGMVLGEGAGCIVLEELAHAEARGAKILGEVIGYGSSTVQDPASGKGRIRQAVKNVLEQSLRSAKLKPADVGHIHAHGLSTKADDADEAQAIRDVFGDRPIPVAAAKSYLGNLGAASGIIEAAASLLALHNERLFPVLNYETPDPSCPITVANSSHSPGKNFISVSFTPQGQASAIVIRRE